jgi:hypothetical protein
LSREPGRPVGARELNVVEQGGVVEGTLEITREDSPTRGRYVGRVAGRDGEAELTFSKASPKLIIADVMQS